MKHLNNNFTDYDFLLLGKLNQIKTTLIHSLLIKGLTAVLRIKNEVNKLFTLNFAWVIGDEVNQHSYVEAFVNNPSPLTHENFKWRCSRG